MQMPSENLASPEDVRKGVLLQIVFENDHRRTALTLAGSSLKTGRIGVFQVLSKLRQAEIGWTSTTPTRQGHEHCCPHSRGQPRAVVLDVACVEDVADLDGEQVPEVLLCGRRNKIVTG